MARLALVDGVPGAVWAQRGQARVVFSFAVDGGKVIGVAVLVVVGATGATRIILPMGIPEYGIDISPDGRYLVYAQLDDPASQLMLVENFH